MSAIGGFFELELPAGRSTYHSDAFAMASGRACLRRIVETIRPQRVWAPFYVCDAAISAITRAGAAVELYAIDDKFDPILPHDTHYSGDVVMYVNYFGIKCATAAHLASTLGRRAIIDDTHAFFQRGYPGSFSFNSARKFFGVPDGGFAYGAGLASAAVREPAHLRCDHLVNRLLGHQRQAFEQYQQSESCVSDEPVAMSTFSRQLLSNVDFAAALAVRRRNFERLHTLLSRRNQLAITDDAVASGPFCYPFLSDAPVPWHRIWAQEIFAPRLWPELDGRNGAGRFAWERRLGASLLPLPIDHRYGAAEMDCVAAAVAKAFEW